MTWGWNVPSPLPRSTETSPVKLTELVSATARSVRPLPVKSPPQWPIGYVPDRVGDLGLERAVAVAQQHRDFAALVVESEPATARSSAAVAGEVPRHDARSGIPTA